MDKLGLLSLQVPILPARGETGDRRSSVFMATAEPLPLRYTSPQSLPTAADAVTDRLHREDEPLTAGNGSAAFAAAETSSSCSSCFWDDRLNDSRTRCSADAAIDCWTACTSDESSTVLKKGSEKAVTVGSQCLLTLSVEEPEPAAYPASLAMEQCNGVAAAKTQKENSWLASETTTQPNAHQQESNKVGTGCLSAATTLRQEREGELHHGLLHYGKTPAVKTELLSHSSVHRADAEDAAALMAAGGRISMLEDANTRATECPTEENSPVLQAAVAGVGSCDRLKGSTTEESACGTGTPTTRFSTEQEEDTATAPLLGSQQKNGTAAAVDDTSAGITCGEQGSSCGSGHGALLPLSGENVGLHSYEEMPSSSRAGYGSDLAVVNAPKSLDLGRQNADNPQSRSSRGQNWRHDVQHSETEAVLLQTQTQPQHRNKRNSTPQEDSALPHHDQNMKNLLAVAAAMVEEHVNGLTYGRNDTTSNGRRMHSKEEQATLNCAAEDEEAAVRAAAAALASIGRRDMDCNGFNGLDAPGEEPANEAIRAAARSSGERAGCLQRGRIAARQEAADTLALALSLDAVMLEVGQEAGQFPNTSNLENNDESRPLPPQTREGDEGGMLHSQNNKKQAGPTEKANSNFSHNSHSSAAKAAVSTVAAGGGAERSIVTRGTGGGTTQVQHTNGSAHAAELPEDSELVECLKGLLTALPRKKDAEARCLLSGEMRFVRPYALQIVDVWKIHLGEAGRTALKKDISERTQADSALKRRVLAISKLKMATLEELVQIAELAGLLVRTLQIANMYETERQVASVTRQSASRRTLSAAAYAAPSQTPPAATQANTYYTGSTGAATSSPGGSSSPPASVNLSAVTNGGGSTNRSSSATSAQTNGNARHQNASSCSPSRAPHPSTVSSPPVSSPEAPCPDNPVSPRSRSAYPTSSLQSPQNRSSTTGSAAAADADAHSKEPFRVFLKNLTGEPICLINNDSPPLTYESIERFASSRLRGLPMGSIPLPAPTIFIERNPAARIRSPSASSDNMSHHGGLSGDIREGNDTSMQPQERPTQRNQQRNQQQLQQAHLQLPPQQQLQSEMQGMQQHQQPLSEASEAEIRCVEADVIREVRKPLSGTQHSDESTQRGARKELLALPPSSTSMVVGESRREVTSPSPEWEGAPDKRATPEVQQQENNRKKTLPQQRRSQQMPNGSEQDEDVIRAADLLAAVAELRVAVPPDASVPQGKTDVSSSSPVEHDELLNGCTLEAAAASALSSPRARALLAAVGDNHRLSRLLEVSSLACLDNTGVSRRFYLDQDVLTLLRLATISGDEINTAAFHGQTGASQGSNSSSSSEAEGAAVREVDGVLCHGEQRPARRKRVRRSAKTAVPKASRNCNVDGHREDRLDDSDMALLQQLHQQLQELHNQQVAETAEAAGQRAVSGVLSGEVHACIDALEAEAVVTNRPPSPPRRPAASSNKKRRSSEAAEDTLVLQDPRHDADTEEEDSETRRRDRITAEAATLLQSTARNHRRCLPVGGHPAIAADCVEDINRTVGTNAETLQSNNFRKATWVIEEESEYQSAIENLKETTLLNNDKEGGSNGMIDAGTASSRNAGARFPRRREDENEGRVTVRSSEERAIAADATGERASDGIGKNASARPMAKSDIDVETRGSVASRNVLGRSATCRTNSTIDAFPGSSAENNSNNVHKGRNGIRQGNGENLSLVAPYNTRRSAAAAAGACVAEGGDICFTDTTRGSNSSGSNSSSRLLARSTMHGDPEGKSSAAEKHDKEARAPGGFGDSVAEQCAREAKQLLERAFKVNDALGFLPASYRLMVGGLPREQETSNSGSNSGTGARGKRSREQAFAGDVDTCAFLQLLATVCLMCLKEPVPVLSDQFLDGKEFAGLHQAFPPVVTEMITCAMCALVLPCVLCSNRESQVVSEVNGKTRRR